MSLVIRLEGRQISILRKHRFCHIILYKGDVDLGHLEYLYKNN